MKALDEAREKLRIHLSSVMELVEVISALADVELEDLGAKRVGIIQDCVRGYFKLPPDVMSSRVRRREYVEARQIAMYLAREFTNSSLQGIAHCFRSDMNHGTIDHGINAVCNALATSQEYAAQMVTIRARCVDALDASDSPLFAYAKALNKQKPQLSPTT